jgi:hypothetical protein
MERLGWHDAFTQPMLLSGELPEQKVSFRLTS